MKKETIPTKAKKVYEKFGHLVPYNHIVVPRQHRADKKNQHSLRCFRMRWQRDDDGNPIYEKPRVRCKKNVEKGYLFCKYHGGRKNPVAVRKDGSISRSVTAQVYRDVYDAEMGDLLMAFLNDPNILDLKPELANLRTVMNTYIAKLLEEPPVSSKREFCHKLTQMVLDDDIGDDQLFDQTMRMADGFKNITSGRAIDRINRCVENIGKTIERIKKVETRDDFVLTPEGLKMIMRAIVNLLSDISNEKERDRIKEQLLQMSLETKGDLSNYSPQKPIDAEIVGD